MGIIKISCPGNEGHYRRLTSSVHYNILFTTKGVYFGTSNDE
jgi:hypothetical protein